MSTATPVPATPADSSTDAVPAGMCRSMLPVKAGFTLKDGVLGLPVNAVLNAASVVWSDTRKPRMADPALNEFAT